MLLQALPLFEITLTVGIGTLLSLGLTAYKVLKGRQRKRMETGKIMAKVYFKALRADIKAHMDAYIRIKIDELNEYFFRKDS